MFVGVSGSYLFLSCERGKDTGHEVAIFSMSKKVHKLFQNKEMNS